jgi:hypothetical protein
MKFHRVKYSMHIVNSSMYFLPQLVPILREMDTDLHRFFAPKNFTKWHSNPGTRAKLNHLSFPNDVSGKGIKMQSLLRRKRTIFYISINPCSSVATFFQVVPCPSNFTGPHFVFSDYLAPPLIRNDVWNTVN